MRELTLRQIGSRDELRRALVDAGLPVDDLDEVGRVYFECRTSDGKLIGFSGLEECGRDVLLRSVVVLPEFRSQGLGRELALATIARTTPDAGVYLATTSVAPFFESMGFVRVGRDEAPSAILSTRQLSGLCPASATIMRLNRPPA
ncbi:GNAT family N-acetyltransferase [Sinorhizobium medicae]|nr:GNAT family N-acetyltransferase [Sinorhizobium medicae]MDX0578233.1 GNAT family N-acetyltransferase [Sinorhizobium medicae]MDX0780055.1 GNAT family N-acetyltransferase [Sinorhizobium medicae]